jgi:hypothetical protein
MNSLTLDKGLENYKNHLIGDYNKMGLKGKHSVEFQKGSKYIKVVHSTSWNNGPSAKSVHSFVVLSHKDGKFQFGDILKAAGWAAPAKNFKRGNVLTGEFAGICWAGC